MVREMLKAGVVRGLFVFILGASLTACGFVTAPLSLATAEVASSGVKAADYSLEQGQQAAIYVRSKTLNAADASWQFLQETGTTLRNELFPAPVPEAARPVDAEAANILAAELD